MKSYFFIIIILILSVIVFCESELSLNKQKKYIEKSKSILRLFHGNTNFVNKTDCEFVHYKKDKQNIIKDEYIEVLLVYDDGKETMRKYWFEFDGDKLIYFTDSNKKTNISKKNFNLEKGLKLSRKFIKKFRDDLNEKYFLKWTIPRDIYGKLGWYNNIFIVYYKGYQTSEFIVINFAEDGTMMTFYTNSHFEYRIPDKIISYDEAKKILFNKIKTKYEKYYNYAQKNGGLRLLTSEEISNLPARSINELLNPDKRPIFVHANNNLGKYAFLPTFNRKKRWFNVYKNGYTEKDFSYLNGSNFTRLAYKFWVNTFDLRMGYESVFIDAETGEIIGSW